MTEGPTPRGAADVVRDALFADEPNLHPDSAVEFMAASHRARVAIDALAAAGLLATAEPHPVVDPMLRPGQAVEFDRWLAEHDAQVLRDAAQEFPTEAVKRYGHGRQWLHARADRIAGGAG